MPPDAGGAGDAWGGRGASGRLLEQLRGIGRKCAFYNGFTGSVPTKFRYVMNILPSFSPYPLSSLPLTKTGKKGTARDNEQKKSKIMVAEPKASREAMP